MMNDEQVGKVYAELRRLHEEAQTKLNSAFSQSNVACPFEKQADFLREFFRMVKFGYKQAEYEARLKSLYPEVPLDRDKLSYLKHYAVNTLETLPAYTMIVPFCRLNNHSYTLHEVCFWASNLSARQFEGGLGNSLDHGSYLLPTEAEIEACFVLIAEIRPYFLMKLLPVTQADLNDWF